MRVNHSGKRRIGHALGSVGILAALAFAPGAHALELRDIAISFDQISTYETRTTRDGSTYRGEPDKWRTGLTAIAGTIVILGATGLCHDEAFSLVYKPGAHSGTVTCPLKRVGTSSSWTERGGSATFTTNTTIVGNVVTLQGTMEAKGISRNTSCGESYTVDKTERITQSLKVRIVGRTCQVLEFHQVETSTEAWAVEEPYTNFTTRTKRLAPGARCSLIRPSEQPPQPAPKEGLGSAVRRC